MSVRYCTNHASRETLRICGRCERPFCPDCLVVTPVGGRCRECAQGPKIARLRVPAHRWPLVILVVLLGSAIAASVVATFGLIGILLGYIAGHFIGNGALWASGRRPGKALAGVTVAAVLLGSYLATPLGYLAEAWRIAEVSVDLTSVVQTGLRVGLLDVRMWIVAIVMAFGASARVR